MQKLNPSFINHGTAKLFTHLKPLFEEPFFEQQPPVTLLPVEPLFQRQLFLKMAIDQQREVFVQLMPATAAGYPINVRGTIKAFDEQRYLLTHQNQTYFFTIQQLRYIAG